MLWLPFIYSGNKVVVVAVSIFMEFFPTFCCQVKILMIKNNRPSMSGLKSTSSIVLQNFWRFFHIFWGLDYMSWSSPSSPFDCQLSKFLKPVEMVRTMSGKIGLRFLWPSRMVLSFLRTLAHYYTFWFRHK